MRLPLKEPTTGRLFRCYEPRFVNGPQLPVKKKRQEGDGLEKLLK
jgi:hypothetical protein